MGERVAFELLLELHRPSLVNLAMRMLRNVDDAHDAVQDTLVKAYRAIGDYHSDRPIRPWLCRICANCCVDLVRAKRRDQEPIDAYEYMLTDSTKGPEQLTVDELDRGLMLDAIERLPEKYRTIIHMRHIRDMEVNEIAEELEKPEGTVKSWLFRARVMLRKDLQPVMG